MRLSFHGRARVYPEAHESAMAERAMSSDNFPELPAALDRRVSRLSEQTDPHLPAIISRAAQHLLESRTAAEVLEAKHVAEAALHFAKVTKAANEAQADCIRIITRAEARMADEIDSGQARGEIARSGQHGEAVQTSDRLKLDRRRVAEWRDIRDAGEAVTETAIQRALLEGRAPTKSEILKAARQIKREETKAARADRVQRILEQASHVAPIGERFLLKNQPCLSALDSEADHLDWIITDPPYPKEFLPVYDDLGRAVAHALKPGGSLRCMIGQSYLPEIVAVLAKHLTYHWTIAYLTPGGQAAQLFPRKVNTFWKPVLWFVKGDYTRDQWIGTSPDPMSTTTTSGSMIGGNLRVGSMI